MSEPILVIGPTSGIGSKLVTKLESWRMPYLTAGRHDADLPFQADGQPRWDDLPEKLGGLIYCPGSILLKPFHRFSDADFLADFELNALGAVRAIRAALPALKAAESASIVLFSTVAVAQGMSFHSSIAMAKGAVEGLTRSLAAELAPKIRVNAIAPSLTDTPLSEPLLNSAQKREAAEKRHPLQAVGDPEDVATLAAFLLSNTSKFITGQVMRPDGGLSSVKLF
ncbi:SDR family NAD(P)-dependent oxidoreductase [Haloferula sargassicola]|uniref:3-oxoacyl-[acyl-carrier-protein] reductase FabG n=1 Tax=Haloferula sargassicola TaxID=490096 RepID=A0ABP9USK8_9BACT